jgi:hypothetical protein
MPARNVGAPENHPQQHGSPIYRVQVLARYHPAGLIATLEMEPSGGGLTLPDKNHKQFVRPYPVVVPFTCSAVLVWLTG